MGDSASTTSLVVDEKSIFDDPLFPRRVDAAAVGMFDETIPTRNTRNAYDLVGKETFLCCFRERFISLFFILVFESLFVLSVVFAFAALRILCANIFDSELTIPT